MWVLTYKGTKKIHMIGRGTFDPSLHDISKLDYYEIPAQDVSHLYQGAPPVLAGTLDDLKLYTVEQQAQLVDRDTGHEIDKALHPFAGIEQQIGVLRNQIVQIINALGLTPTDGFANFNEIAIAKIQDGEQKKEAL